MQINRPQKPKPDERRKVRFREEARAIVAKDRYDRKYGLAVDTAGAISRALERAYRQGVEEALVGPTETAPAPASPDPTDPSGPIDWVMIPPRPRTAFWSICLFILGKSESQERAGYLEPAVSARGTPAWRLIASNDRDIKVIAEKTILPLVRLGLIALNDDEDRSQRLLISDSGRATWKLFLERGGRFPDDLTAA